MKVYRCDFYDQDEGATVSWHSNKKEAEDRLKQLQLDRGATAQGPEGVAAIEIPSGKRDLIDWLNENLNRDNG